MNSPLARKPDAGRARAIGASRIKIDLAALVLSAVIAGCAVHSGPEDNLDFQRVSELSELEGTYKNEGDPQGYLSSIIWGQVVGADSAITHEDIELIGVAADGAQLFVKAIRGGCVIYEREYTRGRDFEMDDGRITLSTDTHLLTRGGDDVLVGPSYEKVTLGLDTAKHGKYQNKGYAAGLIFMIFPVVLSGDSEIRFDRVDVDPRGYEPCSGH